MDVSILSVKSSLSEKWMHLNLTYYFMKSEYFLSALGYYIFYATPKI